MPAITGALAAVPRPSGCDNKGFVRAYWTKTTGIDLATMFAETDDYDPILRVVKLFEMLSSAVFTKINFDKSVATYRAEYTDETGKYTHTLQFQNNAITNALQKVLFEATKICAITLVLVLEDASMLTVGIDTDGFELFGYDKKLRVSNHTIDLAQKGNAAVGNNAWTISGQSEHPPLFYTGAESAIPV